jgi:hypothetical protein
MQIGPAGCPSFDPIDLDGWSVDEDEAMGRTQAQAATGVGSEAVDQSV